MNISKIDYPALIAEFEQTKLTQKAFCELKKIKLPTFQSNLYKKKKKEAGKEDFLPIKVLPQANGDFKAALVEIQFSDGTKLKFSGVADPVFIKHFLPAFAK